METVPGRRAWHSQQGACLQFITYCNRCQKSYHLWTKHLHCDGISKFRKGLVIAATKGQQEAGAPDDITVRVGPLVNTAPILQSLGCAPGPVFRLAGLRAKQLNDPDRKLPYLQLSRLLSACVAATGCECFGLLVGQAAAPSHLGIAGFLARAAPDVGAALDALVKNLDLHDEGGFPLLQIEPNVSLFGYAVQLHGAEAIEQIYDLSVALCYNIMRVLCGESWRASEVLISRRRPREEAPYNRLFRTSIRYDAEMTGVAFSSHWLEKPVASADALLFRHLEQEAGELRRLRQLQLADALPLHLRRGLLQGDWSARTLAATIGLHERKLHRRLRAAGTSYRRELDKVRHALSLQLLEGTDLSVTQVSDSMGYANSSAFIRAFSRWTGSTPMEWRRAEAVTRSRPATN